MMVKLSYCVIALLAVAVGTLPGVRGQGLCGYYEEGSDVRLTCNTNNAQFKRFEPRLGLREGYQERGYCGSDGVCTDLGDPRYKFSYSFDAATMTRSVTMLISGITRDISRFRCYLDGNYLLGTACRIAVYFVPLKPICSVPEFIDGGRASFFTCTSPRIVGQTDCSLRILAGDGLFTQFDLVSVTSRTAQSTQYPGDREFTCDFQIRLDGIIENPLTPQVSYLPTVIPRDQRSNYPSAFSHADPIPVIDLISTDLANPEENNIRVNFDPVTSQLELPMLLVSNPPPYIFSLSMREEDSALASATVLPSNTYKALYVPDDENATTGTLTLSLGPDLIPMEQTATVFTFFAGNGVVDSDEFQFNFTVKDDPDPPSVSHVCDPNMMVNYLCGQSVSCNCTLKSGSSSGFSATWFDGGITDLGTDVLTLIYDPSDPEVEYTCEAIYGSDRTFGSSLKITTETSCDN